MVSVPRAKSTSDASVRRSTSRSMARTPVRVTTKSSVVESDTRYSSFAAFSGSRPATSRHDAVRAETARAYAGWRCRRSVRSSAYSLSVRASASRVSDGVGLADEIEVVGLCSVTRKQRNIRKQPGSSGGDARAGLPGRPRSGDGTRTSAPCGEVHSVSVNRRAPGQRSTRSAGIVPGRLRNVRQRGTKRG